MVVPVRAPRNDAERFWFYKISDFTRNFIAHARDYITGPVLVKPFILILYVAIDTSVVF